MTAVWMLSGLAAPAAAQGQTEAKPAPAAELTVGYAGFADDALVGHSVIGGALRFHLTPRLSVGPEIAYMDGPGDHSDLMLTGNVTFDLLRPRPGVTGQVTPFLVGGLGMFRNMGRFGSSNEGAFTAGAGVRGWITRRVYAAGEFRIGWELHMRFTGSIGVALNPLKLLRGESRRARRV